MANEDSGRRLRKVSQWFLDLKGSATMIYPLSLGPLRARALMRLLSIPLEHVIQYRIQGTLKAELAGTSSGATRGPQMIMDNGLTTTGKKERGK
jgi:hypothetical protein